MFEKEAEEIEKEAIKWVKDVFPNDEFKQSGISRALVEFAELGYNKANEWHKVADEDLPKENKLYLVQIKDNGLAIAYFNGRHWETRYNLGESGHCVETVIAWCEIPTFEE